MVGPEQKRYAVHETRLRESSAFFTKKLDGLKIKKEWPPHEIYLPDENKDVVYLYLLWLYCQRVCIFTENDLGFEEELIKLFLFGEKLADGDLKDAVIDALIVWLRDPLEYGSFSLDRVTNEAYQGTPADLPLRRLLVDVLVHRGDEDWMYLVENNDFLKDVAVGLMIRKQHPDVPDPTSVSADSCFYHHHGPDKVCYVKKYELTKMEFRDRRR